jgi:hypothetical protein
MFLIILVVAVIGPSILPKVLSVPIPDIVAIFANIQILLWQKQIPTVSLFTTVPPKPFVNTTPFVVAIVVVPDLTHAMGSIGIAPYNPRIYTGITINVGHSLIDHGPTIGGIGLHNYRSGSSFRSRRRRSSIILVGWWWWWWI